MKMSRVDHLIHFHFDYATDFASLLEWFSLPTPDHFLYESLLGIVINPGPGPSYTPRTSFPMV